MTTLFHNTGDLSSNYKSVHDLSHEYKTTFDMGELIPTLCIEANPGDVFKVGNQSIVRFQPLVAPVLHEVNISFHYFFVPYRILDENWESFIVGWNKDDFTQEWLDPLPRWMPTNHAIGSLWDYLRMGRTDVIPETADCCPIDYPRRAYNLIYNEYYRDENLQSKVSLANEDILLSNWEKDYFTAALPFQQKGIAPSLPISGSTNFLGNILTYNTVGSTNYSSSFVWQESLQTTALQNNNVGTPGWPSALQIRDWFNNNEIDASSFDISDLRLAVQLQKWQERSARGGQRYTEVLRQHHGKSPRDERLQRPEYFGGSKAPVIFSEVLQTSETSQTPQANMAGHGLSVSDSYCGRYSVVEYGLIMAICRVLPRTTYQQGINRMWLRRTKEDFFWKEFVNLSEQAIENCEIYVSGDKDRDIDIFGYQSRYDELRYVPSGITGNMRNMFSYWHLGRIFATPPYLNGDFVTCNPDKRIFAVQDEDGLIVSIANLIKKFSSLPMFADPGYMDHH